MAAVTPVCVERSPERNQALVAQLRESGIFPGVPENELTMLVESSSEVCNEAGEVLAREGEQENVFMILLEGSVRISRQNETGGEIFRKKIEAPAFTGEVVLLSNQQNFMRIVAETALRGLHVGVEEFWSLMAHCRAMRSVVLAEMRVRIRGMQSMAAQQEKLATLGTLTAGLMHELNNPGAAAHRAASQLRSNLQRMHEMGRNFNKTTQTEVQRECINGLQERILATHGTACLSSLEQADAEEIVGEWLDTHGVDRAWEMAPVLVNSAVTPHDLDCVGAVFPGEQLQQALQWVEAIASSVQMTELIEESVTRVSELAKAVKSYAHEGQQGTQDVDVNDSIHTTLVILKHKFREKNISLEKRFAPDLPKLHFSCTGLNQVWTNLLDNAIDAVGPNGHIRVQTWAEGEDVLITIGDDGPGIPPENQKLIFDPFFTTKPAGVGTGLGLGIVQRVLEGYNARLDLRSQPGNTEFTVRIPIHGAGE